MMEKQDFEFLNAGCTKWNVDQISKRSIYGGFESRKRSDTKVAITR